MERMVTPLGNDSLETPDPWYALRVRSNCEKNVSAHLEGRGYAPFLPVYRLRRTWSDRQKEITLPLFPGYIFCRFPIQKRLPIVTTPGIVSIVGAGKQPLPIDESEMSAILSICNSDLPAQPWPYLRRGDYVVIERGSLQGVEGILVDYRKGFRLIVSITLLQRSVGVEIDRDWVRPITVRPVDHRQAM